MIKPDFEVNGVDGAEGASGLDRGNSTASVGQDGERGGHGDKGRRGASAGEIAVRLTTPTTANIPKNVVLANPIDADVQLNTAIVSANGHQIVEDKIWKFKPGDLMRFYARGGDGGNGGDGGDGEHGGNGFKGLDATRYSYGTDGGPGGKGGDGGDAGKGGDGGDGGDIRISVPKADTHLLVLYGTAKNSGGKGGLPGNRGIAGSGGMGGAAGSPYRYLEYDDKQNRVLKTIRGGECGRPGNNGLHGVRALPGQDGRNGKFRIEVTDGEIYLNYDRIFNLNLIDFELTSVKQDEIIEPGCRVLVSSIWISNVGGMPTPTKRSVLAYIKPEVNHPWVVSEGYDRFVQLTPGLVPNVTEVVHTTCDLKPFEVIEAEEYLAFGVAPVDPVRALSNLPDRHLRGEAFTATASLTIRAQMTPFGRDFDSFVNPMPFTITYPVKMSPVTCLPSLLPGGNTLVKFSVSNESTKEYGRDSEIRRVVIIKATYTGGDLSASKVQFVPIINGNSTSPIASAFNHLTPDESQVLWPIPRLSAKETSNLSGRLSLLEDAEPYTRADFSVDLFLGEICNPLNPIRIQHRQISICASIVYKKTPNSGILLVVNQQTTKEELKAWKELAGFIFGDRNPAGVVDVWDISLAGNFDLNSVLKSGSTLIKDWRSCTIVVLDNPFDNFRTRPANKGQDDNALRYINPDQLAEAAVSNGIHFCVVSPLLEKSAAQHQHLIASQREIDFTSSMAFETVRHLLDPFAIEPTSVFFHNTRKEFVENEINICTHRGFMSPWSKKPHSHITHPKTSQAYTHVEQIILVQKAKSEVVKLGGKLLKELLRKHPERRYTLSVCDVQEIKQVVQQAGHQLPPKTRAAIRVRRLLDVSSLSSRITLTAAPASPVDNIGLPSNATTIHTPEFIKSPQVTSAFVQSIPYERRISLYVEVLRTLDPSSPVNEKRRAEVLRASLLADLACEQEALRLKKKNHGLTKACFRLLLPRLSAFCHQIEPPIPLESEGGLHLLDLLAYLKAYMASKSSWYHMLSPGDRSYRVTKVSNELIDDFISRNFGPETKSRVKDALSKTRKKWAKDFKSTKKSLKRSGTSDTVTSKGHAFATLLGSVACKENKWADNPNDPASIAGSVCTEFGMFFTPAAYCGLGSTDDHSDAAVVARVSNQSIERKKTIRRMNTVNKELASAFTANGPELAASDENGAILPPYQLFDNLDDPDSQRRD